MCGKVNEQSENFMKGIHQLKSLESPVLDGRLKFSDVNSVLVEIKHNKDSCQFVFVYFDSLFFLKPGGYSK